MSKHSVLALSCLAVFVFGFPFAVHFVRIGGMFGALIILPLAMVAWSWGERAGLLTALGGAVYLDAVLVVQYRIIQDRHLPPIWIAVALFFNVFALFLVDVVARLNGALRQKATAESAHRLIESRILAMLSALPDHVFEFDRHGRVHEFRPSQEDPLREPLGPSPLGQTVLDLLPTEVASAVMKGISEAGEGGHSKSQTFSLTQAGKTRWYELSVAAIGDPRDPGCRFVALGRDITERRTLEQQLIQSQKMEAVGRLAGGIAHDFNNILQAIIGFSELILAKDAERQDVAKYATIIKDSAQRAASLTQHLLAFSRKQMVTPRVVDIDVLFEESLQMLRRMIGENVTITHEAEAAANHVRVDPAQLTQVIINLAVNARDAMPSGGRLGIKVKRIDKREGGERSPEMLPGEYVLVEVADTGSGMDKETLSHIFEPFFTTKVLGTGVGLGLSIVYGIVKQSGGYIYVESGLGRGTTFSIYLPRVEGGADSPAACPEEEHSGTETILVVEDEEAIGRLVFQNLTACGYRVLQVRSGAEAVDICSRFGDRIHLLLADVVLPDMSGDKVARKFRSANPFGRVVFMTGYSDSPNLVKAAEIENAAILQKPFALANLRRQIRLALDRPQANR